MAAPGAPTAARLQAPLLRPAKTSVAPARPGTPLSAAINLTATAAGAGMLTLPWAFMRCGPGRCLGILAALAVVTDVSLVLLVRVGRATGLVSFGPVVERLFGDAGSRGFQALMAFILFSALTVFQRVVLDLLPMFLEELCSMSRGSLRPMAVSGLVNCCVLTACMSDTFHGLRFSSGASLALLVPFVGGLLWKALDAIADVEPVHPPVGEGSLQGLALAPALLAGSLCCHFGIIEIDNEMQPKFRTHMYGVIHVVCLLVLPLTYALVGLAGVAALGADTSENVLVAFEGDRLMQFARGLLSVTNALRMPLMVKPLLGLVRGISGGGPPGGASRVLQVAALLFCSLVLAQWMVALTSILGLLLGTVGVIGCYCLPGYMYLRLCRDGAGAASGLRAGAYLTIAVGASTALLQVAFQ
ncbi:unnamed protein product [Prorocentrum cordatum]|uniref:Amino acid transporter transmembrane domain-containing protein n=1 Tax=Prorocentrum cordatum TaxID=2364126 RepID=A0ABN9RQQ4_9DINO|nr:unnamed protein product [Polarella glacialis]